MKSIDLLILGFLGYAVISTTKHKDKICHTEYKNNCQILHARRFGTSVSDVKTLDGELLQTFEYYDDAQSFVRKSPSCTISSEVCI